MYDSSYGFEFAELQISSDLTTWTTPNNVPFDALDIPTFIPLGDDAAEVFVSLYLFSPPSIPSLPSPPSLSIPLPPLLPHHSSPPTIEALDIPTFIPLGDDAAEVFV